MRLTQPFLFNNDMWIAYVQGDRTAGREGEERGEEERMGGKIDNLIISKNANYQ